jgi:quinolinate synthase
MANRVMGCTAQVWVTVGLSAETPGDASTDNGAVLVINGGSDSDLSAGVVAVLREALQGLTPQQALRVDINRFLAELQLPGSMQAASGGSIMPSRANAAGNVLEAITRRVRALLHDYPVFPSLLITADQLTPQGAFAEAQAQYLSPDAAQVCAAFCSPWQHAVGKAHDRTQRTHAYVYV